jgi:uncharacterized protein YndB with AHSA1/START domain
MSSLDGIADAPSGGSMVAVQEEVRVDRSPAEAFRLFTEGIGEWWPLEEGYSFGGDRAKEIHLEARVGGRLYERFVDGDEFEVGRVIACEAPHRIVFTWKSPRWSGETEIEVSFSPDGDGTRVRVEHRGFERLGPAAAAATRQFGGGWPRVLRAFAARSVRPDPG